MYVMRCRLCRPWQLRRVAHSSCTPLVPSLHPPPDSQPRHAADGSGRSRWKSERDSHKANDACLLGCVRCWCVLSSPGCVSECVSVLSGVCAGRPSVALPAAARVSGVVPLSRSAPLALDRSSAGCSDQRRRVCGCCCCYCCCYCCCCCRCSAVIPLTAHQAGAAGVVSRSTHRRTTWQHRAG